MEDLFESVGTATETPAEGAGAADSQNSGDSGFNTDDFMAGFLEGLGSEEADADVETPTAEEEAPDQTQPEADPTETEAPTEGETSTDDAEQGQENPETYTLKHLGKDVTLGRDELLVTAQKGLNYDHVVNERNRLTQESEFINSILKPEADKMGMSIPQYLEAWQLQNRASQIRQQYLEQGAELPENVVQDMARLEIGKERSNAEQQKQQAGAQKQQRFETKRNEVMAEAQAVLQENNLTEFPAEVLAEIAKGVSPQMAFMRHQLQQKENENKILKQNQENLKKSPPPIRREGKAAIVDPFLDGLFGR